MHETVPRFPKSSLRNIDLSGWLQQHVHPMRCTALTIIARRHRHVSSAKQSLDFLWYHRCYSYYVTFHIDTHKPYMMSVSVWAHFVQCLVYERGYSHVTIAFFFPLRAVRLHASLLCNYLAPIYLNMSLHPRVLVLIFRFQRFISDSGRLSTWPTSTQGSALLC